jgi:hypothetical protein
MSSDVTKQGVPHSHQKRCFAYKTTLKTRVPNSGVDHTSRLNVPVMLALTKELQEVNAAYG